LRTSEFDTIATALIPGKLCPSMKWGMRLPIVALATALLVSILPAAISAQTGNGILDI
jgi:hypothetical protein